jgi:hypothetical protein
MAQLLTSELVTNALRHTQSDAILVDIWTRSHPSGCDRPIAAPAPAEMPAPGRDGRARALDRRRARLGLGIDALPGDGKRIWFELPR